MKILMSQYDLRWSGMNMIEKTPILKEQLGQTNILNQDLQWLWNLDLTDGVFPLSFG